MLWLRLPELAEMAGLRRLGARAHQAGLAAVAHSRCPGVRLYPAGRAMATYSCRPGAARIRC
jgi:hypothetical protein